MTNAKTISARILSTILAVCLLAALFVIPASAAPEANEAVNEAKNGVVQIQVYYVDPNSGKELPLWTGSGFLINDYTVVTCEHVVAIGDDVVAYVGSYGFSTNYDDILRKIEYRVMVLRDVYVEANVKYTSAEMDYAVIELREKLHNRTPLAIRSSSELRQTEAIFSLGFPGDMNDIGAVNTYDPDDVTITSGNVNKVSDFTIGDVNYWNVNCVEHSALIAGGNSGGPLVDVNGNVVAINSAGSLDHSRNLAVSSDQLIATLDALGVTYTKAGPIVPDPTEPDPTEAKPTEAPTAAPTNPPEPADEPKEDVKEDKKADDDNMMMIIIIAAAALVVIVVVVVVVVAASSKNKKPQQQAPMNGGYVPPAPAARPAVPVAPGAAPGRPAGSGFTSAPIVPAQQSVPQHTADAGETTVLSQGAGETTVLSQNINGGSLIRKKNGEVIKINAESFVIGRERKSANYCIADNSSIGRAHAKIVLRNEKAYLVDMKSTNGTFVNGVKAMPNQEVELKNGDKVTLADEELEYKI